MKRRRFLLGGVGLAASVFIASRAFSRDPSDTTNSVKLIKTDAEWKKILTEEQYHVLREEGTERPLSSPLNHEKRKGTYVCVACDSPLFTSEMKFDSGTGWPSFFTSIPNALETKLDFKLLYPRTEYHCATCGGHQGHIFNDGPEPTGQRWCNNGVALRFIAA
jgi:peptide-methionine (R)-S-oxide reductase